MTMRYKIEIIELRTPLASLGHSPVNQDEKIYEQKLPYLDLPTLIIAINNQQKDPLGE